MKNTIRTNIPQEFYKIELYNDLSFPIVNALKQAFIECDHLLKKTGHNKYQNLIAIFFPHLTKLLTTYTFCKYEIAITEIQSSDSLSDLLLSIENNSTWPVNYLNVFNRNYKPIGHEYLNVWPKSTTGKLKRFLKILYSLTKKIVDRINDDQKSPSVLLSPNTGFSLEKLSNTFNCIVKDLDLNTKAYIPLCASQMKILFQAIEIIEQKLTKLFPSKFKYDNNFLIFLEKELLTYSNLKKPCNMQASAMVLGSLADLKCRINASIAKSKNIPVISVWHGDNIGEKDEPQFGPVKQTFCDVILGYGDYGCQTIQKGSYNKGLFERPVIYPASSENVNDIYQDNRVENISNFDKLTIMYVPTSFNGIERNGPYRDIHDFAYLSWQKNMIRCIIDKMKPKRLIRKRHRKEHAKYEFQLDGIEQIHEPDFLDLIDMPDAYIFDYPTTAFAFAAATDKPIIYFDIGLRNLMLDALESIKDRCIYVKGNPEDAESLVSAAFKDRHKQCINTYTTRYSISQDPRSREEILVDLIKEYAKA